MNCISSMLNGKSETLCPALEQLKEEHISLRKQMDDFYDFTQAMEKEEVPSNYETLQQLYDQVRSFVSDLEPHSEREEGFLFEMVATYIGRTSGPIAVMEYEHDEAKRLLHLFLSESEQSLEAIEPSAVKEIAANAANAYLILTEHFMKEENVLFPLANQLLTPEEKDILEEKIKRF